MAKIRSWNDQGSGSNSAKVKSKKGGKTTKERTADREAKGSNVIYRDVNYTGVNNANSTHNVRRGHR